MPYPIGTVGTILRNGTERNGTRMYGLNWRNGMLSQIEACSLPLLYKLSVALPAGNQTYPKKDKTNLRIDCGFLLVVISNEVLIVGIADSVISSSDISSRELNA